MSTIWPDRTYQSRNTSSILSFKKVERTCASFSDVKIMIFAWQCPITEKKDLFHPHPEDFAQEWQSHTFLS